VVCDVCVCARARACVRVCVRACVCVCAEGGGGGERIYTKKHKTHAKKHKILQALDACHMRRRIHVK
jgi:hypothetical protein